MSQIKIDQLFLNKIEKLNGIYMSDTVAAEKLSYSDEGSDTCFSVEDSSFWFQYRKVLLISLLKKYKISKERFFLDIGGGNGFMSYAVQEQGYNSVLIEPGINGVKNAKSRDVKQIIHSTIGSLKLNKDHIEAVGIFDVLEHIEDDKAFLSSISENLNKDGVLFIMVPAFKLLWSHADVEAFHFRRYRIKQVKKLLQQTGFAIDYSSYFFSFLFLPIFLFRTIPTMLGKEKNSLEETEKEHDKGSWVVAKILKLLERAEISLMMARLRVPFGTSALIVAKKK